MTDLQSTIAKIRELLPKVYEGVWSVEEFQRDGETWGNIVDADGTIIAEIRGALEFCGNGENAAYIALLNPVTVASLLDREGELQRERDEARLAIEWANNSLFGSKSFFLSTNGLDADPHHLDRAIEELKRLARREALEEAAKLIEDGYPRPGISYKLDTCLHDKFQWEDCEGCAAWAIRKLAERSSPPPQSHVVAVKPLAATLLYSLLVMAKNEGVASATDPNWTSKDFTATPEYKAVAAAMTAPPAPVDHVDGSETVAIDRSLLEAAIAEIRGWKVAKGGDDQVVLNLEAALSAKEGSEG